MLRIMCWASFLPAVAEGCTAEQLHRRELPIGNRRAPEAIRNWSLETRTGAWQRGCNGGGGDWGGVDGLVGMIRSTLIPSLLAEHPGGQP